MSARGVLVITCGLLAACGGRHGHRLEAPTRGAFPIPADVRAVSWMLPEGQISFEPGTTREVRFRGETLKAADTAELLAQFEALDLTPRLLGITDGVMRIEVPSLPASVDARYAKIVAKLVVELPPEIAITAETGNGPLGVTGWRAEVRLRTGHGKLYLSDCEGDATLRGSGAPIIVDRHRGNLDAFGSEMLIQVFMARLGDRLLRVVNTNGAIQAHVPADASFELDLVAVRGEAANSFGIPAERGPESVRMRGTVGDGGPLVHLETIHRGNVSLAGTAR